MSMLTIVHVIISLVALVAGAVVVRGLLNDRRLDGWTLLFLVTTILTNATGFLFPFQRLLSSHIIAALALVVLALTWVARYPKRLDGRWLAAYVGTAIVAFYFNVFIFIVQLFLKVPALHDLAPTQTEPPFLIVLGIVLVGAGAVGVGARRAFTGRR